MEEKSALRAGNRQGLFITFEGGEGAGKSTQIRRLARHLESAGHNVLATREPGGSPGAEAIRDIVLSGLVKESGVVTEALLMSAARADHVRTVILPALEAGKTVLCDRFSDSTRAYQGPDLSDPEILDFLGKLATAGLEPTHTIILDIPAESGLDRVRSRAQERSGPGDAGPDRFESDTLEQHERRRRIFLEIAASDPDRCIVVDALQNEDDVFQDILRQLEVRLGTDGKDG